MQLETSQIEEGMVRYLVEVIGHRLAKDNRGRPNAIVAYPSDNSVDKGLKPDQPFMTVCVVNATTPFGWLLDKYIDEEDRTCYKIAFQINVMLSAYGKGSHSIITELKQRMEFDENRDLISELTGTRLYDSGMLPNNYDYLNTEFEQYSPLIISLVMNSVLIDPTGGIIEKVITDGQLKYSDLQTIPEITLHIEAP
ncbi:hypothetical protein [Pectobacterium phage Wc4-1]|uniref:Phage neck terminator protein gp12-like domain-containing protein n=1 Tax=Pectobacterium phage Wc4 TaxID=2652428 RepID=A0A5P8D4E7_9CAUD|nr:hypothetical protein [Pectobacterium phage Wc4]QFP94009.1 hypothetical protein [Pectobacterium phage Wc4-1]